MSRRGKESITRGLGETLFTRVQGLNRTLACRTESNGRAARAHVYFSTSYFSDGRRREKIHSVRSLRRKVGRASPQAPTRDAR